MKCLDIKPAWYEDIARQTKETASLKAVNLTRTMLFAFSHGQMSLAVSLSVVFHFGVLLLPLSGFIVALRRHVTFFSFFVCLILLSAAS